MNQSFVVRYFQITDGLVLHVTREMIMVIIHWLIMCHEGAETTDNPGRHWAILLEILSVSMVVWWTMSTKSVNNLFILETGDFGIYEFVAKADFTASGLRCFPLLPNEMVWRGQILWSSPKHQDPLKLYKTRALCIRFAGLLTQHIGPCRMWQAMIPFSPTYDISSDFYLDNRHETTESQL